MNQRPMCCRCGLQAGEWWDLCENPRCPLKAGDFPDPDLWPPPETRMLSWVIGILILAVIFALSGLAVWILP